MLRQTFQQKLLQKLSPAQIQLMKLLQLPITSLEERIKEEMEINPALEDGSEEEIKDEKEEDDLSDEEKPDQRSNHDEEQELNPDAPQQLVRLLGLHVLEHEEFVFHPRRQARARAERHFHWPAIFTLREAAFAIGLEVFARDLGEER